MTATHTPLTPAGRSERDRVKLLYAKSKVYIHPTAKTKDNISGWLTLVERTHSSSSSDEASRKNDLLISWIPDTLLQSDMEVYVKVEHGDGAQSRDVLVATPFIHLSSHRYSFSLPLTQVYSVIVRPPRLSWWHGSIIVNTRSGESKAALFFHDSECESTILEGRKRAKEDFDPFGQSGEIFWGGIDFMDHLKAFISVEQSSVEPNLYLIEPSTEDLTSLKPPPSAFQDEIDFAEPNPFRRAAAESASSSSNADLRWKLLEKFSRLTTLGRRAAEHASDHILSNPTITDTLPPSVLRVFKNEQVEKVTGEFEAARVYLAKWAMTIEEAAEKERRKQIAKQDSGDWSLGTDADAEEHTAIGSFELLTVDDLDSPIKTKRGPPLSTKQWHGMQDDEGRFTVSSSEIREIIFHGGIEPALRPEVWPFLLGVYSWDSSHASRTALSSLRRDEYYRLKSTWWDGPRDDKWKEQRNRIEKDIHRTDRNIEPFVVEDLPHPDPKSQFSTTNAHMEMMKDMLLTYNEYNVNLGYVQGMSDFLSVLYAEMQDDAIGFWAFVGFMNRMERNFLRDQSGMRTQLLTLDALVKFMLPKLYAHLERANSTNFFFFFRMLLVWYKREFCWDDILLLWEVCWTDWLTTEFHLFIALAILDKHKDVIVDHLVEFDEVLKYGRYYFVQMWSNIQ